MNTPTLRRHLLVLASIFLLTLSGWAAAEPPSRVARLSAINGSVSFSPAGQPDWLRAAVNRPLTNGDRLWVATNSRAELQIGGASIRLGPGTSVTLLNLDNRIAQVQLSQGTMKLRVRRMGPNQAFEVNTPNLAFSMRRPGEYRIEVDPNDDATAVRVHSGRAELYGDGASYVIGSGQGYRFYGTGLVDYDRMALRRDDDFDRWGRERDRRADNSPSARFVSYEVIGYEDLDANGTWRVDPDYGNIWTPTRVAANWTPYRDGHWSWIDPWGWTWIDDAPWGFAVSHYGRWARVRDTWAWVPGPAREQAVYAPALVGFVGGQNYQGSASIGSALAALIGWFPLAPREVYQPSYPVSRSYFERINRSNAVIPPATITNIYNTTVVNTTIVNNTTNVTQVVYANRQVAGAVVAVPAQAFVQSQPVAKATVAVSKEAAISAPVAAVAAVAPVQQSVQGGAPAASVKPPVRERGFVVRSAPPPPPVAFAAQQQQLAAKPGRPIDEGQRKQLAPAVAPAATAIVVTTVQASAPSTPPPATAPAAKSPDARKAEAAKVNAAAPEAAKSDTAKADGAKAAAAKAEAAKLEAAKLEADKVEAAKVEAARAEALKADTAKSVAAKAEASRADAAKAEAAKGAAAKAEASRADAAKAEAAKAETVRAEALKADAAKGAAAKADASRADAAKAEAVRAEAQKAEAAKGAAAKAEASRVDAAKAEAASADAAKAALAKGQAAKADAAKVEAARADSVNAEATKAALAKADASRADAAKAEAVRAETAKAAMAKAESARADSAKAEATKIEAARADAAKADASKAALAKAETARADGAKAAATKAAAAASQPRAGAQGRKIEADPTPEEEKKKAEAAARKP